MNNDLVTIREAMAELRVSRSMIVKLIKSGKLKREKIERLVRIPRDSIREYRERSAR